MWLKLLNFLIYKILYDAIEEFNVDLEGECGQLNPTHVNRTKQGCVLAALLFSIFFAMMLIVAFRNGDTDIPVQFRPDGCVFNLRRQVEHTPYLP